MERQREFPWGFHLGPSVGLYGYDETPMGLPHIVCSGQWVSHGAFMILRFVESVRMDLLCDFQGFAVMARGTPMGLPWVCIASMGSPVRLSCVSHTSSTYRPWIFHGPFMGLQCFHWSPIGLPWIHTAAPLRFHGSSMALPWVSHGFYEASPWVSREARVDIPWVSKVPLWDNIIETPMGLPWDSHAISMGYYCSSGPWDSHGWNMWS